MTIVEPVYIYETKTGQAVEAELHHAILGPHVLDWKNHWQPACNKAIQECYAAKDPHRLPDSWHWDWERKVDQMQGLLAMKGFSVVCNGMTEGLMKVITPGLCNHPEHKGKHLVYIDYLESAPWNLPQFIPPGKYKGIGDVLVQAAVNLSHDEGFKGRIGLHSVPKAESFYLNHCGMADLGPDKNKQGLKYFEMTEKQAHEFAR